MHKGQTESLRGLDVCFSGTLQTRFQGQLISRDQAHALARAVGLVVHERGTQSLDVLVVADPESLSGKAEKARSYGIRIMAETVFWQAIGLS
jgi:DNA polymerase-3 subunit epsilon